MVVGVKMRFVVTLCEDMYKLGQILSVADFCYKICYTV